MADTNVIASLWVPNDMEQLAYNVLKKDTDWVAPLLWRSEFKNVLATYLRADIISLTIALEAAEEAEHLMRSNEFEVNAAQVLTLVSESTCSSYDCEFVALAKDLNIKLVTFDQKLVRQFPEVALLPEKYIS